ncbi:MAG: hypothetical protein R3B89_06505 [Polyangiaceae bacterium]
MPMTSEGKAALGKTIRALRARLLDDLKDNTSSQYRLGVRLQDADLDDTRRALRRRLENWLKEQVRTQPAGRAAKGARSEESFLREAEQQAAYTWLNRLVILKLLECPSQIGGGRGAPAKAVREPALVTGGWESRAYKDFRQLAPSLVRGDDSEGYRFLLDLAFQDLAQELPGVFGPAGVADLIPISAGTLRHVVDQLNQPELDSCWSDDMTLGWVYQYWNDPSREALDAKLNAGGKVESHEIASKTQMFTERYMVDWLLQNSLGPMWLAMCQKHGWTADLLRESGSPGQSLLARLEARRADWRQKREAGEVELTDLMPLESDEERRWAYVPQPIPKAAVEQAPESLRSLQALGSAVGSGHCLVALELLFHLYREEAKHRRASAVEDAQWTVKPSSSASSATTSTASTSIAPCRSPPPRSGSRRWLNAWSQAHATEPGRLEPAPGSPAKERPSAPRAQKEVQRSRPPRRADRQHHHRAAWRRSSRELAEGRRRRQKALSATSGARPHQVDPR